MNSGLAATDAKAVSGIILIDTTTHSVRKQRRFGSHEKESPGKGRGVDRNGTQCQKISGKTGGEGHTEHDRETDAWNMRDK